MAHCRAFLLPSRLEGLPITLLEAMSHGRPCLVGDIPPHLDVIAEGKNGFLHDHADIDSLRHCLASLDEMDADKLAEIGARAHATVDQKYDWEDVIDSVEALYQSVIS